MDLTTFYGRKTELRDLGFLQDVFDGIIYLLVPENVATEWLKLRFQYLALTPDVIHLLETLRYVENDIHTYNIMQKYLLF